MKYALGIDIGGTNLKLIATRADGSVVVRLTQPMQDGGECYWPEHVKRMAAAGMQQIDGAATCIGVAAPGLAASCRRSSGSGRGPSAPRGLPLTGARAEPPGAMMIARNCI